jgi:hypothetical protein
VFGSIINGEPVWTNASTFRDTHRTTSDGCAGPSHV